MCIVIRQQQTRCTMRPVAIHYCSHVIPCLVSKSRQYALCHCHWLSPTYSAIRTRNRAKVSRGARGWIALRLSAVIRFITFWFVLCYFILSILFFYDGMLCYYFKFILLYAVWLISWWDYMQHIISLCWHRSCVRHSDKSVHPHTYANSTLAHISNWKRITYCMRNVELFYRVCKYFFNLFSLTNPN